MMRYRITIEIEGTLEQIKLDAGRTLEQLARRMETVENDRHLKELMFASGGGGFPFVGCSVRALEGIISYYNPYKQVESKWEWECGHLAEAVCAECCRARIAEAAALLDALVETLWPKEVRRWTAEDQANAAANCRAMAMKLRALEGK